MVKNYTPNQTGAIAILFASAWWGIDHLGADMIAGLLPTSALTSFLVLLVILWILVPLYVKRIKWSYIVGIVLAVISIIGMTVSPGGAPISFAFPYTLFSVSTILAYLFSFAFIYFSYKSYKELK